MKKTPKIALVLGGGAPNLTLMAGALAALDEQGVEFEVLSTSGAGMLIGMLYAAPKGKSRQEALKGTLELGVHDSIYSVFPVNYKVFHKVGDAAVSYNKAVMQAMASLPPSKPSDNSLENFWKDAMAFWTSAFCPWDPRMLDRLGLCQPAPWIDEVVDFDKLRHAEKYKPDEAFQKEILLNAFCIDDRKMVMFDRKELTAEHFRAALAFPLVYEPFELDGKTYVEGSAIDPLNFEGLFNENMQGFKEQFKEITDLIVLDVLGRDKLIGKPRNLYDSWVKSMIVPLVSVAEKNTKMFQRIYNGPAIARDAHENPIVVNKKTGDRLVLERGTNTMFLIPMGTVADTKTGKILGKKVNVKKGKLDYTDQEQEIMIDGYIGNTAELDDEGEIRAIVVETRTKDGVKEDKVEVDDLTFKIERPQKRRRLHRIEFDIKDDYWPNVLDWSRSNLKTLFDIGYKSATDFIQHDDKQHLLAATNKDAS